MPLSADGKKKREVEILKAALIAARKRGGECRRLSDRINGTIIERSFDERPDIVLRHEGCSGCDSLVGIEHFRIDQLREHNAKAGKPTSATMRAFGRLDRLRRSGFGNGTPRLDDRELKELGGIIDELLVAQGMESHGGFLDAFSETFNSHLSKSATYRVNIAQNAADGGQIKLAFLIETHADYSRFRCWDGCKMRVLPDGELPLFRELVQLFSRAAGHIDYLILAMCPQFSSEVVDARIINCSSLKSSLARQKAKPLEYLGFNRSLSRLEVPDMANREPDVEVNEDTDTVTFRLSLAEGVRLSDFEVFQRDMDSFAKALELQKERRPFLATFGVSMLLELFGDYALRNWSPGIRIDLSDLISWKNEMGPAEWRSRNDRFREGHGIRGEYLNR